MIISFFTQNLIWTQGASILVLLIGLSIIGMQWMRPLGYLSLTLIAFSFYFFRSPERICLAAQGNPNVIVCPADGTIVDIKHDAASGLEGYAYKVSIFLSLLDAHVNWIPVGGIIESMHYTPGTFTFAFLAKSSLFNEHNDTVIVQPDGGRIKVRQIAGMLARRICWWVIEGQRVEAGSKFGMIRFGSRVDLFLPENVHVMVGMGQRVYGGFTVIGEIFTLEIPSKG